MILSSFSFFNFSARKNQNLAIEPKKEKLNEIFPRTVIHLNLDQALHIRYRWKALSKRFPMLCHLFTYSNFYMSYNKM